jgi:hypothetical protein
MTIHARARLPNVLQVPVQPPLDNTVVCVRSRMVPNTTLVVNGVWVDCRQVPRITGRPKLVVPA